MLWQMRRAVVAFVIAAATGRVAVAAPRDVLVDIPPRILPDDGPVRTIYLNPCVGGCTVTAIASSNGDSDDAVTFKTIILQPPGQYTLDEFAFGSAAWAGVVACVQQVYSAYDVTVTDQQPTSGVYNEALVAGLPAEGNLDVSTLGIAPISSDCSPLADEFSIVFANADPSTDHVTGVCWTAAQEVAHIYGLDHEYEFLNAAAPTPINTRTKDPSACSDPMTYQTDCGGQKFFRDWGARCGEFGPPEDGSPRKCRCSEDQNSHATMTKVFGSGAPTWTAPTSQIVFPGSGAVIDDGSVVHVTADAQRGIAYVELVLNGAVWTSTAGSYGTDGLPVDAYTLYLPSGVPDSVIDIVARAHDDLGGVTDSAPITVTKGSACTSSSTCAAHQSCDGTGRCVFPAATATLGDACGYDQECTTSLCQQGACTQNCDTLDPLGCPSDFHCQGAVTGSTAGTCETGAPSTGGGCCDAGGAGGSSVVLGVGLVAMMRRKRTRARVPSG
jgi:hypothetical protein